MQQMTSKTNKEKEAQDDMALSIEDRTNALLDKQFAGEESATIPSAHMDLYAGEAPVSMGTKAASAVEFDSFMPAVGEALIPSMSEIFQGKEHLVVDMQKTLGMGTNIDFSPEPKNVKIKKSNEPESLYLTMDTRKEGPPLFRLLLWMINECFPISADSQGEKIVKKIMMAKLNTNIEPVSLLRQRLWDLLGRRQFRKMPDPPSDRTPLNSNPRTLENQRLRHLLGENVFDELVSLAETVETSNKSCFAACLSYALSEDLIEQEPSRKWLG
jgi:hypothetical protein